MEQRLVAPESEATQTSFGSRGDGEIKQFPMKLDKFKNKAGAAVAGSPEPAKKRAVRRCTFVAAAEVTEPSSGTLLSARTSELGLGGCYVETLNPFGEGTIVQLRIVRDQGVFEAKARVVYSHGNFGMGLAFTEMAPKQRSLLEDWLAEIVMQSRPASQLKIRAED